MWTSAAILNLVEQLLTKARLLADWTDDGEIGWVKDEYTGEPASDTFTGELIPAGELGCYTRTELLQQIAEKWIDLHCVMSANGLWENWFATMEANCGMQQFGAYMICIEPSSRRKSGLRFCR